MRRSHDLVVVAVKHVLVVPHKHKAIELQKKLDTFAGNFDRDLLIEIWAEQGLIFVPDIQCPGRLICDLFQPPRQKMRRWPLIRRNWRI